MTNTAPLTQTMTPDVCARIIETMHGNVYRKITGRIEQALTVQNLDLLAADGTSPVGEWVMAQFNRDMDELAWNTTTRRMVRTNIRAVVLTLIRDTAANI